ncbi:MAG: hypothetical protein H7333_01690 [Bdellovibrionales bacterium]|nr:hypothetical protein [Oligoflexia bacterium]
MLLTLLKLDFSVWGEDGLSLWAPAIAEYLRGNYEHSQVIFNGQNLLALYGELPFWRIARFFDATVFQTLNLTYFAVVASLYVFTQTIFVGLTSLQTNTSRIFILIYCIFSPVVMNRVYAGHFNLLFGMMPFLIAISFIYNRSLLACTAGAVVMYCSFSIQSYQILAYHLFYVPLLLVWLNQERAKVTRDYFLKVVAIASISLLGSMHSLMAMAKHAQDPENLRTGYGEVVYSYVVGNFSDLSSLFLSSVNTYTSRGKFFLFHEINYPIGLSLIAVFFLPKKHRAILVALFATLFVMVCFASALPGFSLLAKLPLIELFRVPERSYMVLCFIAPLFLFAWQKNQIDWKMLGLLLILTVLGNGVPGFELLAIILLILIYFSKQAERYAACTAALIIVGLFLGLPEKYVQVRDSNQIFSLAVSEVSSVLNAEKLAPSELVAHFTGSNALQLTIAANFLGVATFEGYGHPPSTHFERVKPFLQLPNDPMTNVFLLNAYSHAPRFRDALAAVGINRIFVDDSHGSLHSFKFP